MPKMIKLISPPAILRDPHLETPETRETGDPIFSVTLEFASLRDVKPLEDEIAKAFVTAYEEQAQSLFNSYLDNAEAHTTRQKLKDPITDETREPDERFMRAIEEQIGITGSSRDGFRSDVTAYMFAKMRRREKVDFKSYEPLKEAIEGYLIASVKDMARIVTKSISRDDEQQKKYSEMVQTMIDEYGYTAESAEEVLTFASNNLWRDS